MIEDLLSSLSIPKSCKVSKKLFKKQFIENFSLKSQEKKVLSEYIESITLEYIFKKETINIPPYINDEVDYSEVAFISVEITNKEKLKQISSIIQYIPYPLITIFYYKQQLCLEVSPKRINKQDSTKLVVQESYISEWIDLGKPTEIQKSFLESLHVKNQSFINLFEFYKSYLDKLLALNASVYSGALHVKETTKENLQEIEALHVKIIELKSKLKKESNFSTKVKLNIEIKELNDKVENLKENL